MAGELHALDDHRLDSAWRPVLRSLAEQRVEGLARGGAVQELQIRVAAGPRDPGVVAAGRVDRVPAARRPSPVTRFHSRRGPKVYQTVF